MQRFRFGVQLSSAASGDAWRDAARKIEGLGYSTLFIPDHFEEQFGPLVALTVALWRRRGRAWCRAVLFAGGYFVAALLPVLGFFNIFFFRHSFVADHFQYLASVGIITLVCAGAATLWKRADLSAVALAKADSR